MHEAAIAVVGENERAADLKIVRKNNQSLLKWHLADTERNPSTPVAKRAFPNSCVGAMPVGCGTEVRLLLNWKPSQSPVSSCTFVPRAVCAFKSVRSITSRSVT